MKNQRLFRLAILRFLILLAISTALVWIGGEAALLLMRDAGDRAPQEVELIIPLGAAERVAAGEAVPSIPDEMTFVLGDVLVVKNEDTKDHQLGPLWVPAQSSASLKLDRAENFAYECSFQTSNYLGLNVRPPTTLFTRFQGVILAAPATAAFLFVYSLLVFPLEPKKHEARARTSVG